jgi:hypothetical protein
MSSATHVFLLVTSGHQVLTLERGTLTLPRATTADRADLPALLAANLDGRVSRFRLLHHGPRNAHLWSALVHGHAGDP